MTVEDLPDWERLLAAERHLQSLVSGAVLVGGTAAALHAGQGKSLDDDHVLGDLRARFDEVLAELEAAAGWQTSRAQRPVIILGRLDGVMTGIRQLRRVPLPFPRFWLAALASLGEAIDWTLPLPLDEGPA